jgi:hypothetical protein
MQERLPSHTSVPLLGAVAAAHSKLRPIEKAAWSYETAYAKIRFDFVPCGLTVAGCSWFIPPTLLTYRHLVLTKLSLLQMIKAGCIKSPGLVGVAARGFGVLIKHVSLDMK